MYRTACGAGPTSPRRRRTAVHQHIRWAPLRCASAMSMRAFVVTAPCVAEVRDVDRPVPINGQVIVDVERAGVCGTDAEIFAGHMSYLETGDAGYPIRIGHEWSGTVSAVGDDVDTAWVGRRVTGDT